MVNSSGTRTARTAKIALAYQRYLLPISGFVLATRNFFAKHLFFAQLLVLLATSYAAYVCVPAPPQPLGFGLDQSWHLGLNLAHARHLAVGSDIAFTYGPLGYLIVPLAISGASHTVLVYQVGLYLLWVVALFRITVVRGRAVGFWTVAILSMGMLLDWSGSGTLSGETQLQITVITVGLIPLAAQTRWRYAELCILAFLAALAAMVKLNAGIAGTAIFLCILATVVRRDWPLCHGTRRQAITAAASLPVALILCYFLSTGTLNIWPYLRSGWEIVEGYPEMGLPGPLWQAALYFAVLGNFLIGLPFFVVKMRGLWAGYVPAVLLAFLQFKHALVRQEPEHASAFLIRFAVILLFVLVCAETVRDRRLIVSFQIFTVLLGYAVAFEVYGSWFQKDVSARLRMRVPYTYVMALVHWPSTWKGLTAAETNVLSRSRLGEQFDRVVGSGTVANLGYNIHPIAAHNWNWRPFAVLQTYAAYTPALDAMNAASIESKSAADFATVDFVDIDSRHPLFSEPLTWRALLDRYDVVSDGGDIALMRRRSSPRFKPPVPLRSEVTGWERDITVPPAGGWLLMSPRITQTFSGKIRSFLLRPSPVFLEIRSRSGMTSHWRTIPSNMAAGVLVHPFLDTMNDLSLFIAGVRRPDSDIVSLRLDTDDPSQYAGRIDIQWFRLPAEDSGGADSGVLSTDSLGANKLLDQFGIDGLRDVPPLGRIIFANPPSRFALPGSGIKKVRFQFGILDSALQVSPPPDGVIFRLLLKHRTGVEDVLWTDSLKPLSRSEDRGVKSVEVNMHATTTDQLIFETLPVKNPISNWSYWRSVVVQK